MKLPRNLSGDDLSRALRSLGYEASRQTGSHLRLTTKREGEHHVTVPRHNPLRAGTLSAIIGDVATHFNLSREDLLRLLF